MRQIHSAGFVYNDLKLDNLLLEFEAQEIEFLATTSENFFEKYNLIIIDFGFSTPYLQKGTEEHVEKGAVDTFRGNIVFSSLHQLKFKRTGRRDDLISIFYVLVYLFKNGYMPGFFSDDDVNIHEKLSLMKAVRRGQTSKDLCFGNTKHLYKYKKEVFSYRFKDTPDYDHLIDLLNHSLKKSYKI